MDQTTAIVLVSILAAVSFAGAGYALLGPRMAERSRLRQRIEIAGVFPDDAMARARRGGRDGPRGSAKRSVQKTLKEIEDAAKGKKKRPTIEQMIGRAGIELTPMLFIIGSIGFGLASFFVLYVLMSISLPVSAAFGFAGGFGAPRWFLGYLASRRETAFSSHFVNAVDVVVRGVKSGLPVGECMSIIARESPDPLGGEFRTLVEGQKLGITLAQGLDRMLDRMPSPELNFFVIVLTIQAQTGGNLSEALGNLANVLRERKQMRAKIQSMSSEAKASAMIIGSLPIIVGLLLFLTSPDYIGQLFSTFLGNIMIAGGLFWMSCGVFVMKQMINFDL